MPYYQYQCTECKEEFEKKLHIDERKGPEFEPCPSCGRPKTVQIVMGGPSFGDPVRLGIRRPDDGFKSVLKDIHEKNAGSTIADTSRYL